MILRCGTDLLEIRRLEEKLAKSEGRLEERLFDEEERAYCEGRAERAAGLFAAKEAAAKALGSGLWGEAGLGFRDFLIRHDSRGRPLLELSPKARAFAAQIGELQSVDLSISHDGGFAIAFCTFLFRDRTGKSALSQERA